LLTNEIETLAIGGFDGVHIAHQRLIEKVGDRGGVLIINKFASNLTPKDYRCKFINKPCFFYDLKSILKLNCEDFANFLKREFKSLKRIVIGYDFRYGYKRGCDIEELKKSFEVEVVDEVKVDGVSVHSGVIREFIKNGKIKEANRLLGRAYSIEGEIIRGQGLGKKELVPTINISVCDFLLPKNGVYITNTKINGKTYRSVTFIGVRESTDGCFSVESHIIDEDIEAGQEKAEIYFFDFIRENQKFNSLKELKVKIKEDIDKTRSYFAKR